MPSVNSSSRRSAKAQPPDLLKVSESLPILRLQNVNTVYRLIERGDLPAVKVGRHWRIRRQDIDAFLAGEKPRHGTSRAPQAEPSVVEKFIAEILAQAPPLSPEQRSRLAELLAPARSDGAA